jgi:EmrB/QacA subfamily drug resistance transporter
VVRQALPPLTAGTGHLTAGTGHLTAGTGHLTTGTGHLTAGTGQRAEPAGGGAAGGSWRWGTLLVMVFSSFMITLDFFIVNVAIPSIRHDLRAGSAAVQLVIVGYGLAYAAGLITCGRLGDIHGRRRMFVLGMSLFTLASAGCGLAPTAGALVAARVAQGMGAAMLAPQSYAILGVAYTGADRIRAFNANGLAVGLAGVFGQLIGGLLIQADTGGLGWRLCFLINVPVGIAAVGLTPRLVAESRGAGRTSLDLPGVALVVAGLVAAVLPLVEGREHGWPPWSWLCLSAAVPLLLAFAARQRRLTAQGGAPLVMVSLFGRRTFTVGIGTTLLFYAGTASFLLVLALYLQEGLGLTALGSGLVFTAIGAGFFVTSLYGPALTRRLGRQVLAAGGLALVAGWAALGGTVGRIGVTGNAALLVPALLLCGVGIGMIMAPVASIALGDVPGEYAGAAAGVLSTALQVGGALGVALIGLVFYGSLGPAPAPAGYPHALALSLLCLVGLAVTVALLAQLMPRGVNR